MGVDYLGMAFGVLVIAGGWVGYAKSGSLPSLLAGITFGVGTLIGAVQVSNSGSVKVAVTIISFLGMLMLYRLYHGAGFMPAGMLALTSSLMVVRYMRKSFE